MDRGLQRRLKTAKRTRRNLREPATNQRSRFRARKQIARKMGNNNLSTGSTQARENNKGTPRSWEGGGSVVSRSPMERPIPRRSCPGGQSGRSTES